MTQLYLDLQAPTPRVDAVWSFGGLAGRAPLLLRKDLRRHLLLCRDELGFRHVRCEGLLGPEMVSVRTDGSLDFDRIESVLDWMMENGLVPFFALGCNPAEWSGNGAGIASRPWQEWVGALAAHVDGRYGCDAREWYFEVCTDVVGSAPATDAAPDSTDPSVSPWTAALRQYDLAARAIREVHPEYRVGGPAARSAAGLDAFLAHAAKPSEAPEGADRPEGFSPDVLRCDFVTAFVGAEGMTAADARRRVTAALGQHVPLIVVGQSPGATGSPPDQDGCDAAARVAGAAVELAAQCQGAVVANVSDINDEQGWRYEPFHGGGGLVTVNDVRKAAFHALRLLHEHAGYHCERVPERWVEPVPGLGCLATRSEHTLRLLLWLQRGAGATGVGPEGTAPAKPIRFTIEGLPASVRTAQLEVIRPGDGSAFEAWTEAGRPRFVNREVLDGLEEASQPALVDVDFREYPPRLEPGMVMQMTMQLPFGED